MRTAVLVDFSNQQTLLYQIYGTNLEYLWCEYPAVNCPHKFGTRCFCATCCFDLYFSCCCCCCLFSLMLTTLQAIRDNRYFPLLLFNGFNSPNFYVYHSVSIDLIKLQSKLSGKMPFQYFFLTREKKFLISV